MIVGTYGRRSRRAEMDLKMGQGIRSIRTFPILHFRPKTPATDHLRRPMGMEILRIGMGTSGNPRRNQRVLMNLTNDSPIGWAVEGGESWKGDGANGTRFLFYFATALPPTTTALPTLTPIADGAASPPTVASPAAYSATLFSDDTRW
ncbi:PREDICTED: uncharacterized protein LOC109165707 [Ipomoea nil]|uniref:uncharacterized protein LOC109165707 n=1 Tax=Ipomoea nil TaxID=35883 RepID=UPI0009008EBD|nr:PREDICTED: uncharacterized protein LOC109165707 [Ipomoea nil]